MRQEQLEQVFCRRRKVYANRGATKRANQKPRPPTQTMPIANVVVTFATMTPLLTSNHTATIQYNSCFHSIQFVAPFCLQRDQRKIWIFADLFTAKSTNTNQDWDHNEASIKIDLHSKWRKLSLDLLCFWHESASWALNCSGTNLADTCIISAPRMKEFLYNFSISLALPFAMSRVKFVSE